ncbi:MAG: rane protein insertase YidC [Rickettsiaceae bacterium]|jgi:YidC/Oxa1 family membrane protein insertase|nr:rane protein insertase YidC [Rickettsiaceae bacterium]
MQNNKNVILASILSAIVLIGWTWLYEKPRMEAQKLQAEKIAVQTQAQTSSQNLQDKASSNQANKDNQIVQNRVQQKAEILEVVLPREEIIESSKSQRVLIKTDELHGSINLKGMVFDDLTLVNYHETLDPKSKEVVLLSPSGATNQYRVKFGYSALNSKMDLPNENSIWKADGSVLTTKTPITFSWKNSQNVTFQIKVAVDEHYMFSVSQTIKNQSGQVLEGSITSNVERSLAQLEASSYVSHEGPIGSFDGILTEKSYTHLKEEKEDNQFEAQTGWFGITDKYWLVSVIPDKKTSFKTSFFYDGKNNQNFYSVNSESKKFSIQSNKEASFDYKLFAGAKKVGLLDEYSKKYDIKLFDRAIDFGWYYFLTKPFFFILQFFSKLFGNYGLAILSITVLLKLAMFPLANKSYAAIAKIKKLQPKIDKIREQFKDKKLQMNKEIMELYKREKVSPVSGCLPLLIQIPVFFSLYKVLYIAIDMRHAPFYGWIKDLSAPDPTSIFNLFGLLPFETHGMFAIGLWPIFMGLTMFIQQRFSPKAADPTQDKVMKLLPFILIFAFAQFPAGLLIYWTWSNSLSILQQWFITKKFDK